MKYPPTRTVEVVADVAGVRVPDPYRWLEEETPEVRQWQQAQAELASSVVFEGLDPSAVRELVLAHYAGARARTWAHSIIRRVCRSAPSGWYGASMNTGSTCKSIPPARS